MIKKPFSMRIDPDLLARVDAARGDVPRARWVERALENSLALPVEHVVQGVRPVDVRPVVRVEASRVPEWVEPPSLSEEQKAQLGVVRYGPKRPVAPVPKKGK